jgi:putative glutamine amidotransferase
VMYQETVHLLTNVTDPFRHYMEASFLFHLLGGSQDPLWLPLMEENKHYLVNGICLGMQTMNVATGGTMIQDIPTEVYGVWTAEEILEMPPDQMHRNYKDMVHSDCADPTSYHFHQVIIALGSFFRKDLKFKKDTAPLVLSSHHQSIESPGKGWVISATSMDGKIIEAIEHEKFPHVIGVQFHPEKPGLFDPSIIHPTSCNDRINFQEVIKDTDSYAFHKAYWNYLGRVLQTNRN